MRHLQCALGALWCFMAVAAELRGQTAVDLTLSAGRSRIHGATGLEEGRWQQPLGARADLRLITTRAGTVGWQVSADRYQHEMPALPCPEACVWPPPALAPFTIEWRAQRLATGVTLRKPLSRHVGVDVGLVGSRTTRRGTVDPDDSRFPPTTLRAWGLGAEAGGYARWRGLLFSAAGEYGRGIVGQLDDRRYYQRGSIRIGYSRTLR